MTSFLNRFFRLEEAGTTWPREFLGGTTTFMTMSYIIFVQPVILASVGMDKGAVMVATCISSALATLLMGLWARYPIALAPAMGHNIFFAVIVCGTMGYSWQVALGAIFISGIVFLLLSLAGLWEGLVAAVPDSLKNAIAVGIGLLITLVGLEYGGLVVDSPGVLVGLGDLTSRPVICVLAGLVVTSILLALRVPGSILIGIVVTALVGLPLGVVKYHGVFSPPPSLKPTLFQLDIAGAWQSGLITVIFVFFFLDLFDTVGTLIGVSEPAGFIKQGRLPRANQAMLADAFGTVSGALLGTSTVTSYIESATGIAQGARTGLANIFTSFFFLVALFFSPLAEMFGGEYIGNGQTLHPVIAPPLIIVGYLMMKGVARIPWDDITEAIPAFLTLVIMPMTVSITEGIAFGFISYSLLKLLTGRGKQVHWVIYLFTVLFIVRYLLK
ncbi:MAG: NCS2 family permease [Candidatus Aminicenantes bacterium]|nr:MAG: NCS2 family permease [Candidatus Aminicenantes bacterium]